MEIKRLGANYSISQTPLKLSLVCLTLVKEKVERYLKRSQ